MNNINETSLSHIDSKHEKIKAILLSQENINLNPKNSYLSNSESLFIKYFKQKKEFIKDQSLRLAES